VEKDRGGRGEEAKISFVGGSSLSAVVFPGGRADTGHIRAAAVGIGKIVVVVAYSRMCASRPRS
jgi:hypothetical protein